MARHEQASNHFVPQGPDFDYDVLEMALRYATPARPRVARLPDCSVTINNGSTKHGSHRRND
jgi:hypothetical protein